MNIRKLTDEEWELQYPVWSQAFEHGDREMAQWREWDRDNGDRQAVYGIFDEAGLQATFSLVDMHVHMGPELILPMGAVNGVAVLPASRGKGYAGAGVRHLLERMRENGQVVSVLEPFSWDFYHNLGYAWIGAGRRYAIPSRVFKPSGETTHVRAAMPDDRARIEDVYTRFAARYRGMLRRREHEWKDMLNDRPKHHTYTYVYEREGKMEGYLTYREGKREETRLREFIYLTARAQSGLLGLLRRHDMQIEKFAWNAPSDDTLWLQFYHWDVETKLRSLVMGRIVDVAGAFQAILRAWKPLQPLDGSLVLAVEDKHASWNAGNWRITLRGETSVVATSDTPDVALDIQALSQAYFGTPSLSDLRRADRLTVHNEPGYELLRALLDGPPMWVNDAF
jgi:predicted acetyltransferase